MFKKPISLFTFVALSVCVLGVMVAQTKIDATQQLKNLAPITTVQRSQCIGNGPSPTAGTWNCNGLQLYKITLADGTILGPYVAVPATAAQAALMAWVTMPLSAPDPALSAK